MQLEITDRCNLRCSHCYHLEFDRVKKTADIPDELVMEMARKLVEDRIFGVVVTGGEPLVRKELALRVIHYLKQNGVYVSLNTNLILLNQASLASLVARGLDSMLVSCPSSDARLYSAMTGGGIYERFEYNLKMLIASGQRFAINMVVNKRNLADIRQTAERMRDLGVRMFGVTPMALNLQNPDSTRLLSQEDVLTVIKELIRIKEKLRMEVDIFEALPKCIFPPYVRDAGYSFVSRCCQAGKTVASIANNGDIRPCSHNPKIYGNLLSEPLETIWEKMSEWRDTQTTPDRCLACGLVTNCFGGCRITAKALTGHDKGEDPWMTTPTARPPEKPNSGIAPQLTPDTVVTLSNPLRYRGEGKNTYLIASSRANRNVTAINGPMFHFVIFLRNNSPISLARLAQLSGCHPGDREFTRVISLLASRGFISLDRERKEDGYE
ncbi:MAG: radical SAM protein [Candidatus Komeilibacteria bacterium]